MVQKTRTYKPIGSRLNTWLFLGVFLFGSVLLTAQTTTNYFRTEGGIPCVPVLSTEPSSATAGAMYINSGDNNLYFHDGIQWMKMPNCKPAPAPDGTPVVEIISPGTGRVWMDRNLGATQAATSETDYLAYGSLYQWLRSTDGHQRINWTDPTTGTPVNGTTNVLSSDFTASNSLFIMSVFNWLTPEISQGDGSLWWNDINSRAGINNPCPFGFHVPTKAEWQSEIDNGVAGKASAYSSLKLPQAGYRSSTDGSLQWKGVGRGYYWSSTNNTTDPNKVFGLYFNNNSISINSWYPSNGFSIRCIKDL